MEEFKSPAAEPKDLRTLFPYASPEGIDFLKKVLSFNPYFRPSMKECLEHPFFKEIRRADKETPPLNKIDLKIDELEKDPKIEELRKMILTEIQFYKDKKAKYGKDFMNI